MHPLKIAAFAVLACAACKPKAQDQKPGDKGATASSDTAAARSAPPAACPAGFTNPENAGICLKLPADVKPGKIGPIGGTKAALRWSADGGVGIEVIVSDYSSALWDTKNKDAVGGGGFGGKLIEQGKLGDDGVWATFSADSGTMERKVLVSRVHNKTLEVECTADKQIMSNAGPKLEDVLDACKTITMAP